MATLYVSEYKQIATVQNQQNYAPVPAQAAQEPSLVDQTVAISGSSTQSAAFNNQTTLIRVHTDAICSIAIAANPTATTSTKRLAANTTEYFGVNGTQKIAVITNV
jgi:hypothetical protein